MANTEQGNGHDLRSNTGKLTDNGNDSSYGGDPKVNGSAIPGEAKADKYGFTGGAQQYSGES